MALLHHLSLETIKCIINNFKPIPSLRLNKIPPIDCASSFTADDWMKWINYYAIVHMKFLLPTSQLEFLRHLVLASAKRPYIRKIFKLLMPFPGNSANLHCRYIIIVKLL